MQCEVREAGVKALGDDGFWGGGAGWHAVGHDVLAADVGCM